MAFPAAGGIGPHDRHRAQIDQRDLIGVLHRRHRPLSVRQEHGRMGPRVLPEIDSAHDAGIRYVDQNHVSTRAVVGPVLTGQGETPVRGHRHLVGDDRAYGHAGDFETRFEIDKRDAPARAVGNY